MAASTIIGLESNVPVRSDLVMLHHFKSRGNKGMGIVFVAGFHVEEMAQKTDNFLASASFSQLMPTCFSR